ncbi:MAG TPA: methyltransferase domain-containing protein [Thermoanaerobaculia bacterium]
MTRSVAFVHDAAGPPPGLDYGARLSRLRWRRAARAGAMADWTAEEPAERAVGAAGSWVVVRDATALPAPASRIPEPPYGRVLLAGDGVPEGASYVHTLRELELTPLRTVPGRAATAAGAFAFWPSDHPPKAGETVAAFCARLLALGGNAHATDDAFRVLRFDDPSARERPELTRRLPSGAGNPVRILDVGCGAGGGIAGARGRHAGWRITGIERDGRLAAQARERCDRVLEGDLREILPRLARDGETFDAIVFADVLEHLEDPFDALRAAARLAAPGCRLLVSVPNVGNLSVVRDLLCGRFDPVPAGLLDAGHLRWFTRESLAGALEESGWVVTAIEGEPGAPSPDPGPLREIARAWPDRDDESLATYQWVAEATREASR